jgi:hypothetical protein
VAIGLAIILGPATGPFIAGKSSRAPFYVSIGLQALALLAWWVDVWPRGS